LVRKGGHGDDSQKTWLRGRKILTLGSNLRLGNDRSPKSFEEGKLKRPKHERER